MRRFHFLLLLLAGVGCGGETESGPPPDPSDPEVVPMGFYAIAVGDASCVMNDAFLRRERVFVVRKGAGANIPMPFRLGAPGDPLGGIAAPRADIDLGGEPMQGAVKAPKECPGGVRVTLKVTELGPTRAAVSYREEASCGRAACTVDYSFELSERVCPPASDPSCVPQKKRVPLGSSAMQDVECPCSR
jgi:hypothetical protein